MAAVLITTYCYCFPGKEQTPIWAESLNRRVQTLMEGGVVSIDLYI